MKVTERINEWYLARREVSRTVDLATSLLAYLLYDPPDRLSPLVRDLVGRLRDERLVGLSGPQAGAFTSWLNDHLTANKTVKGMSYYPVHPVLTLPENGEQVRVRDFIRSLAACFSEAEKDALCSVLWSQDRLPLFELTLYDVINWQLDGGGQVAPPAPAARFKGGPADDAPSPADEILLRTKEDLLALSQSKVGIQSYVSHAGRLLAMALARFLLAKAGVCLDLPIYAAPAADSHEGAKTLAHGIIETHRSRFEAALKHQFLAAVNECAANSGCRADPRGEEDAIDLARHLFHRNARVVTAGQYRELRGVYGSFGEIAYYYYWYRSGAGSRFLRQLHTAHLNLAKKAGFASSRSEYSQWHFYWLAPALVETLLLVSRPRLGKRRVLVGDLLRDWRDRYGTAVLIDQQWETAYRTYFQGLGSPEALNEANMRRFTEILSEQGRLHKNSDDFPWVILGD